MERYAVFVPKLLPKEEAFLPDSSNSCKGCGEAMAVRQTYKALGAALIKKGNWKIPWKQSLSDLKAVGKKGEFMPALLRIPKKDKKVLSICFDNEARTDKKEMGKEFWKKSMPEIAVADGVEYVATACPGYPFDLIEKVKKAFNAPGDAYIHILCPCPAGWGFDPSLSVKIGKLAVDSTLFPLYEVVQGSCFMTVEVPHPLPVKEYLKYQERCKNFAEHDIEEIQKMVSQEYIKFLGNMCTGEQRHGHS